MTGEIAYWSVKNVFPATAVVAAALTILSAVIVFVLSITWGVTLRIFAGEKYKTLSETLNSKGLWTTYICIVGFAQLPIVAVLFLVGSYQLEYNQKFEQAQLHYSKAAQTLALAGTQGVEWAANSLCCVIKGCPDLSNDTIEKIGALATEYRERAIQARGGKATVQDAMQLEDIADAYQRRGRKDLAEPLLQKIVTITMQEPEKCGGNCYDALVDLLSYYRFNPDKDKAEEVALKQLDDLVARAGPRRPDWQSQSLLRHAVKFKEDGNFKEAEELLRKALAIDEAHVGTKDVRLFQKLCELADVLRAAGKLSEVESLSKRVIAIAEQQEQSPNFNRDARMWLSSAYELLGDVYFRQRQLQDAESCYLQALDLDTQCYGDFDRYDESFLASEMPARDLVILGMLYDYQQRFAEADAYYGPAEALNTRHYAKKNGRVVDPGTLVSDARIRRLLSQIPEELALKQFDYARLILRRHKDPLEVAHAYSILDLRPIIRDFRPIETNESKTEKDMLATSQGVVVDVSTLRNAFAKIGSKKSLEFFLPYKTVISQGSSQELQAFPEAFFPGATLKPKRARDLVPPSIAILPANDFDKIKALSGIQSWSVRGYRHITQKDKTLLVDPRLGKSVGSLIDEKSEFLLPLSLPKTSVGYARRGCKYTQLGLFQKALADLNKAIELDAKNALAYTTRAEVYDALDEKDNAKKDLDRVIAINPEPIHLLVAYRQLKQYDKLLEVARCRSIKDPNNSTNYFACGEASRNLGRIKDAVDYYTKALALEPNAADLLASRGLAYHELKQFDLALQDCSRAIELNANDSHSFKARAKTNLALGNYADALVDCNEALTLDPTSMLALERRARAYEKLGNKEAALEDRKQLKNMTRQDEE